MYTAEGGQKPQDGWAQENQKAETTEDGYLTVKNADAKQRCLVEYFGMRWSCRDERERGDLSDTLHRGILCLASNTRMTTVFVSSEHWSAGLSLQASGGRD